MELDLSSLSSNQVYHLMTQSIVPRPVAWVLSDNGIGEGTDRYNLAPFSYFNAICSDPPLVILSIGKKLDGSPKDTRRNIGSRGQFVIHLAQAAQAPQVTESSRTRPHGDSALSAAAYLSPRTRLDGDRGPAVEGHVPPNCGDAE